MNTDSYKENHLNRFRELAERSERERIYIYSDFHSPTGASFAYQVAEDGFVRLWGGCEDAERVMVRFGCPEDLGYDEDFPIVTLRIAPTQPRFADELSHRDFLGALMNLGIERSVMGDVLVQDKEAYVFVCERIAPFITESLTKVKHTTVKAEPVGVLPESFERKLIEETLVADSERLDGIVAKVYHLSRSDAKAIFAAGEVFVNGRMAADPTTCPQEGNVIAVRGKGKFRYDGVARKTSKDRYAIVIARYGS
ncbi:MAG: hypothetical protein K6B72_12950 [Lachnospiraceae bacterium]|nr:hypothetical protein [Lachnospiraceae bacterium]